MIPQDIENVIYKYLHNLYMIDIIKDIDYINHQTRLINIWEGRQIYNDYSSHLFSKFNPGKHHFERFLKHIYLYKKFIKAIKNIHYNTVLYNINDIYH
jgi:hypothetical protein